MLITFHMNCSKHRWFIENIRSMTYRHITQCSCSFNTEHARAYTSYRESYFTRIFTYILLIIATFNRTLMMPAPLKISAQTTRHTNKYFVINTVFIINFLFCIRSYNCIDSTTSTGRKAEITFYIYSTER